MKVAVLCCVVFPEVVMSDRRCWPEKLNFELTGPGIWVGCWDGVDQSTKR
jgi:hypothetical protein